MKNILRYSAAMIFMASVALSVSTQSVLAQEHSEEAYGYVHEAPNYASETWTLAAGGRIYDNGGMR